MGKKLKVNDKVDIVLSREKSLRKIASTYGVHHSSIDEIFKESSQVLEKYWQEKSLRQGRPKEERKAKVEDQQKVEQEREELEKQVALKQMRIDWLELQLKWESERAQEEKRKKRQQLKKRKK
jgi:hypothetical protein